MFEELALRIPHEGVWYPSAKYSGPRIPNSELQMTEIERSRGWMIAAVVLAAAFIAGLGPGVKFHPVRWSTDRYGRSQQFQTEL